MSIKKVFTTGQVAKICKVAPHGDIAARFWSYVHIAGESECWLWTGCTDKRKGYGQFRFKGKAKLVQRVAWELIHGEFTGSIARKDRCDRRCVNPAHLILATTPKLDTTTKKREGVFLQAVQSGEFRIDELGHIWRLAVRRGGSLFKVPPSRAESAVSNGYFAVGVSIGGVRYDALSHRVAWCFFTGQDIPDGLQINHINGEKSDNRLSNLEIVTPKENTQHAIHVLGRHGSLTAKAKAKGCAV